MDDCDEQIEYENTNTDSVNPINKLAEILRDELDNLSDFDEDESDEEEPKPIFKNIANGSSVASQSPRTSSFYARRHKFQSQPTNATTTSEKDASYNMRENNSNTPSWKASQQTNPANVPNNHVLAIAASIKDKALRMPSPSGNQYQRQGSHKFNGPTPNKPYVTPRPKLFNPPNEPKPTLNKIKPPAVNSETLSTGIQNFDSHLNGDFEDDGLYDGPAENDSISENLSDRINSGWFHDKAEDESDEEEPKPISKNIANGSSVASQSPRTSSFYARRHKFQSQPPNATTTSVKDASYNMRENNSNTPSWKASQTNPANVPNNHVLAIAASIKDKALRMPSPSGNQYQKQGSHKFNGPTPNKPYVTPRPKLFNPPNEPKPTLNKIKPPAVISETLSTGIQNFDSHLNGDFEDDGLYDGPAENDSISENLSDRINSGWFHDKAGGTNNHKRFAEGSSIHKQWENKPTNHSASHNIRGNNSIGSKKLSIKVNQPMKSENSLHSPLSNPGGDSRNNSQRTPSPSNQPKKLNFPKNTPFNKNFSQGLSPVKDFRLNNSQLSGGTPPVPPRVFKPIGKCIADNSEALSSAGNQNSNSHCDPSSDEDGVYDGPSEDDDSSPVTSLGERLQKPTIKDDAPRSPQMNTKGSKDTQSIKIKENISDRMKNLGLTSSKRNNSVKINNAASKAVQEIKSANRNLLGTSDANRAKSRKVPSTKSPQHSSPTFNSFKSSKLNSSVQSELKKHIVPPFKAVANKSQSSSSSIPSFGSQLEDDGLYDGPADDDPPFMNVEETTCITKRNADSTSSFDDTEAYNGLNDVFQNEPTTDFSSIKRPSIAPSTVKSSLFSKIISEGKKVTVRMSEQQSLTNGLRPSLPSLQLSQESLDESELPVMANGKRLPSIKLYKSIVNKEYFHDVKGPLSNLLTEDGMFLIRPSTSCTNENPLSLCVRYVGTIHFFKINKRSDNLFAIASEKANESRFLAIEDLVVHHREHPIRFQYKHTSVGVLLKSTPPK